MSRRGWTSFLRAGSALGLLVVATAQANAGGFAVREQSTYGQGTSFAGVAAGGALSSMYWNPATMTQFGGIVSESGFSAIIPHASQTPVTANAPPGAPFGGLSLLPFGGVSNSGELGLPLNSYFSYQLNPSLWLGMSFNAPFGLMVNFPDLWAGRNYGASTSLKTYNGTPTIAWRITDWLSVGAGVQIQYAKADLRFGFAPSFGSNIDLSGLKGWGYGATAGITLTPGPRTTIGIGWRSAINQKADGQLSVGPVIPGGTPGAISTTVNLPDTVSAGIRHRFDERWTVMGTVEWTNWSRIGTVTFTGPTGGNATVGTTAGPVAVALPFQYRDGWFFSGGAEYQWSERLALRSGIAFERSPVTDQVRMPDIPDNDRFWLSAGLSWQIFPGVMWFDLAYSHIWVKDPSINISAGSGNPWFNGFTYIGNVDAHVDIFSGSLVWRFGAAPAPKKALITK
jgi:long-chain fatty acid transport protein